jgi:hypothetical protein
MASPMTSVRMIAQEIALCNNRIAHSVTILTSRRRRMSNIARHFFTGK